MARPTDTIAALATPAGTAALAVIRISGPATSALAAGVMESAPPPRSATHADYRDRGGSIVDDVVATLFVAPNSYTGEDSLEISCHGNPFIIQKILTDLFARGCRPAHPGEFTKRAFLNGRMDLSQAEAVMDLISARSERALVAARQVLRGALGRHLADLVAKILGSLATIEAYIDFPDEDLPPEDRQQIEIRIASALAGADRLLATERTGALLREGIGTVILGEPNVGKSSLLNRMLGSDRAIVSPEPGTTRDFIEERFNVGPHGLRLVDTAGLNPDAGGIEALGIEKTLERAAGADLYLLVLDATRPSPTLPQALRERINPSNTIVVLSKVDLLGNRQRPIAIPPQGLRSVEVSALKGSGFEQLLAEVSQLAEGLQTTLGDERIAINARHAHYLAETRACLASAIEKISTRGPSELIASDLRGALASLGEISGKVDNERMLDQLFASFCIGK
ncbi:MAG TPA: tRNA uridine-5-carboxymethylaminomethyl(34) synthesis GTPase MnmE [Opitutaceae bacterium]|nr:tRNA uridine-5-carboxymethylaminomethyl(34) synthesis GTPase MnmE [Opitutaceae bacterium]